MARHVTTGNQLDLVLAWDECLNTNKVIALSSWQLLHACQDIPLPDPEGLLRALASQLGYEVTKRLPKQPKTSVTVKNTKPQTEGKLFLG